MGKRLDESDWTKVRLAFNHAEILEDAQRMRIRSVRLPLLQKSNPYEQDRAGLKLSSIRSTTGS